MTEEGSSAGRFERWVRASATIVAPATVLSALLFYFGYVCARSRYEYFGIDVDTIGLGTQDYIMRSPQPLLVPLLVLAFLGIGSVALHTAVRRRIAVAAGEDGDQGDPAEPDTTSARRLGRLRHLARATTIIGMVLLGAGIVLLFAYALVRDWAFYALVTPFLLALGAALTAYGSRVLQLARHLPPRAPAEPRGPDPAPAGLAHALLRRTSSVLSYVVVAAGVFWITATVAQWSGRGLAQYEAQNLNRLPSVILDTRERLFLRSPGIEETVLPESQGQTFHYRYRHLRLLIHGHDRMFLVPDAWSASNSTLVVALDASVRVQFQFQNRRP
jgi:hypothetical protein